MRKVQRHGSAVRLSMTSSMALSMALSLGACLDHELEEGELDGAQQFIVLDRDFANFRSWQSFARGVGEHDGATGPKNVYINHMPVAGALAFPNGTIVIKTIETANPMGWQAHAMVKRGGDFNRNGAYGWEFFDLKLDASGSQPAILWRGERPPSGHGYESLPGVESGTKVDCNACHTSQQNDAVISVDLTP